MGISASFPTPADKRAFHNKIDQFELDLEANDYYQGYDPIPDLTQDEARLLLKYSHGYDYLINTALRDKFEKNDKMTLDDALHFATMLTNLMKRAVPLSRVKRVYRGMHNCNFLTSLFVGNKIVLGGFVSTSVNIGTALNFSNLNAVGKGNEQEPGCMLEITLPIGSRVIYMGNKHQFDFAQEAGQYSAADAVKANQQIFGMFDTTYSAHPFENEILISSNSVFEITGMDVFNFETKTPEKRPFSSKLIHLKLVGSPDLLQKIDLENLPGKMKNKHTKNRVAPY